MTRRDTRRLWTLVLSFAVYAVPVVSPHWIDFFGVALWRELVSDREAAWVAADLALGLGCQVFAGAVAWFGLGWSRTAAAGLMLVAGVPVTYAINAGYQVVIPTRFLIESDRTPGLNTWAEQCTAKDVWLDPAPAGITRGIDAQGEAVVRIGTAGDQYGILRAADCVVETMAVPKLSIAPGLQQVLPDGSVVYAATERNVPGQTFWLLRRGAASGVQLVAPPETGVSTPYPVVSDDGGSVAWTLLSPDRVVSVDVYPVEGGEPVAVTHALFQRTTLIVIELDMTSRTLIINRGLSSFAAVGLDGHIAWGPLAPADLSAQYTTLRYSGGRWLAWDAYVEGRAKRVMWSAPEGAGTYTVPKGRDVTAGALHPRGRYIALSTTTALSIGSIADTVLVRRVTDGAEVFRKTLPAYARSHVAFLGNDHFAYTDYDGATVTTRVLRLP